MSGCRWRWASAPDWARPEPGDASGHSRSASRAPLAIIELSGDITGALTRLGVPPMPLGSIRLVRWPGVDELMIARVSDSLALVFPHAGPAALHAVVMRLNEAGIAEGDAHDSELCTAPLAASATASAMPARGRMEWGEWVDAQLCAALGTLRSAMGVDVLLEHAHRARERGPDAPPVAPSHAQALRRLLVAPTIAAIGPPNVGKSSLLNALAQRQVSIVADEPGTTRDHVGVRLNLAGLEVQYVDCPGWRVNADEPRTETEHIEHAAEIASRRIVRDADLVLSCGDPVSGFLSETRTARANGVARAEAPPMLRVLLRADLESPASSDSMDSKADPVESPRWSARTFDHRISVHRGEGLEDLVAAMVCRLVSDEALCDSGVWAFWDL